MSSNAQKTWFGDTQNRFASKKALDAIQVTGRSLPASVAAVSGGIVTINFELDAAPFTLPQVTCALATDIYSRAPIQVGDKGFVTAADARLGGVNGLGTGTATRAPLGNLSALVFHPIGNAAWEASPDPQAYLLQGPNGFILRNMNDDYSLIGNSDGIVVSWTADISATLDNDGVALVNGSYSVAVKSDGVYINGSKYLDHTHDGGTIGSGETGTVTP